MCLCLSVCLWGPLCMCRCVWVCVRVCAYSEVEVAELGADIDVGHFPDRRQAVDSGA